MPTIEQAQAWYPTQDPVHGFDHIVRVYHLAEHLARAEGADVQVVCAAALLHDAEGKTPPVSDESSPEERETNSKDAARQNHHHASAEFARRILEAEGWPSERVAAVEHCIRSHRFRHRLEAPQTLEAQVLFDADKLDAIGAIGVARAVAFAARKDLPAYAPPSELFLHTGHEEAGEPHSAYHEYLFKLVKLKDSLYTQTARRLAEDRHHRMAEFFSQLVAETDGKS